MNQDQSMNQTTTLFNHLDIQNWTEAARLLADMGRSDIRDSLAAAWRQGKDVGYSEGYKNGQSFGFDEGYSCGYEDGDGFAMGRNNRDD